MQLFDSSEENPIKLPAGLVRHMGHAAALFRGLCANTRIIIWTSVFWMLPVSFSMVYLRIFMKEQGLTELEIGTLSSIRGSGAVHRFDLRGMDLRPPRVEEVAGLAGSSALAVGHDQLRPIQRVRGVSGRFSPQRAPDGRFLRVALSPGCRHPPTHRAFMFGLAQAPWMLGGLLTPLAGPLVGILGVTAASRWVFASGAVLMAAGVFIRARLVTEQGRSTMRLKADFGEIRRLFLGHWTAFRRLVRRHHLFAMFFVQVMTRAVFATSTTYLYLFLADARGPLCMLVALFLASGLLFAWTVRRFGSAPGPA